MNNIQLICYLLLHVVLFNGCSLQNDDGKETNTNYRRKDFKERIYRSALNPIEIDSLVPHKNKEVIRLHYFHGHGIYSFSFEREKWDYTYLYKLKSEFGLDLDGNNYTTNVFRYSEPLADGGYYTKKMEKINALIDSLGILNIRDERHDNVFGVMSFFIFEKQEGVNIVERYWTPGLIKEDSTYRLLKTFLQICPELIIKPDNYAAAPGISLHIPNSSHQ